MKTYGAFFAILVALAMIPASLGSMAPPPSPPGGAVEAATADDASLAALEGRVSELEQFLATILGGPAPVQEPCQAGVGCAKFPGVVDEIGDTMTGALNMDRAEINLIPEGALDGAGPTQMSTLNGTGSRLFMPIDYFSEIKLLEGSKLNTTNQSEVFIDFAGNLTFADGSFLNPFGTVINHDATFTQNISVFENITIHEGATMVFQNNTSIILSGSASRIGTEDDTPFVIIVNNTTAVTIYPGQPKNTVEVTGDIVPGANDTYALGNNTHRWDALYMASTIDFANDLLYTSGGVTRMTLGTDGTLTLPGTLEVASIITTEGLSAANLLNGSVTSEKIADGAIFPFHLGAVCGPDQVLKYNGTAWVCGDDIDTDTTYGAGSGLSLFNGTFSADTTALQARVLGTCAEGSSIRAILADGTVVCEDDSGTLYTAGSGLVLAGTEFSVDYAAVQSRVSSVCAEGSSIRGIFGDGTVVCEVDDDTDTDTLAGLSCGEGAVAKWSLSATAWICAPDVDTDTDTLGALACNEADVAKFDGVDWGCAVDIDTDTDTDTLAALTCAGGELAKWNAVGSMWECATDIDTDTDTDTLAALSCADQEVAKWDDPTTTWGCKADQDTTYSAGAGLTLAGTLFEVDFAAVQQRVTGACTSGSAISVIFSDGTVACEIDDDTLYSAGVGLVLSGTSFAIDDAVTQRRVSGSCVTGEAIRVIAADGTVTCETLAGADAGTVDGLDSSQFLRSDNLDTFNAGLLTLSDDLFVGSSSGADDDTIWFDAGFAEYLRWADASSRFQLSDDLQTAGGLIVSEYIQVGTALATDDDSIFFDDGASEYLRWKDGVGRFELSDDLELQSSLFLGGASATDDDFIYFDTGVAEFLKWDNAGQEFDFSDDVHASGNGFFDGHAYVGHGSGTDSDFLFFDVGGEYLQWEDASNRFQLSGDLSITGAGTTEDIWFNAGADWLRWDDVGDRFEVSDDLVVHEDLHVGSATGTDDDSIFFDAGLESVKWDNANGRFVVSDDFAADSLSMGGTTLANTAGDLTWGGDEVCRISGNCPGGATLKLVAPNDVRLESYTESGTGTAGFITGIAGADVTPVLTSLGSTSVCYVDFGTTGDFTDDGLYLNVNGDTCVGNVEAGDLRLVAFGGHAAFSTVSGSHTDFNGAFGATTGSHAGLADGGSELRFFDADANGMFNEGDTLYADVNGGGSVSAGDYRWTNFGASTGGTRVFSGNSDVGLTFGGSFVLDTAVAYWDALPNGSYSSQDLLYIDVSEG